MIHGVVCALAAGIATSETAKAEIRNKAIAVVIFFVICIFLCSPFILVHIKCTTRGIFRKRFNSL
jgi:hypothetical protein